ncbi:MAG: NnrU family protein [Rhodobacteraceae bacterium]|nr:NnrU family protein [Paracoccaceae bacterium]
MGWAEYIVVWVAFLVTHYLPSIGGAGASLRNRLITRFGRGRYFAAYGIISTLLLIWMIGAAARAPQVLIWDHQLWHRWAPNLAMPLAIWLAVVGAGMPYAYSLGGRRGAVFDPAAPGAAAITRHPFFWALALWSLAHLLANGSLAHVMLFGGFAFMAIMAVPLFDLRAKRALSAADWQAVRRTAPLVPRLALSKLAPGFLARRSLVALVIYLVIIGSHSAVIGRSPMPL